MAGLGFETVSVGLHSSDSLKGRTSTLQVLALTCVQIVLTLLDPYWVSAELWDIQAGELGDRLYQCPLGLG